LTAELQQLVNQCLAKDESAMVQLFGRFRERVHALCYRMLGQRQDAEDAVQETFARVARSLTTYDSKREFEPWLLQIAANRCRTFLAHKKKRPTIEPLFDDTAADFSNNESNAAQQLAEEVDRALDQIRPEWREAFLLFHQHELSYIQISQRMNCPIGTVKTWVHRSRRQLILQLQAREVIS
jgi:RNA polymerase sigma-70 factor (ECF subfamily)